MTRPAYVYYTDSTHRSKHNPARGFTIIELLIVIVVIAILAAITIVAYNGIQQRARDSQRASDMAVLQKALEMYYADNGEYPASGGTTMTNVINSAWTNSTDASWDTLINKLKVYVTTLGRDPVNTPSLAGLAAANKTAYNYSYYSAVAAYCSGTTVRTRQMYIIGYRMEGAQSIIAKGDCTDNSLGTGYPSMVRVSK